MKLHIDENILQLIEQTGNFDFEAFKSIKSFKNKIQYASTHLPKLGAGSSRIVYDLGNDKVLKLAKNTKGIAQNEHEYDVSRSYDHLNVVPAVYDFDENYSWIVFDKIRPAKKSDIQQIIGVNFDDFVIYVAYKTQWSIGGGKNNHFKDRFDHIDYNNKLILRENETVQNIIEVAVIFKLHPNDLIRISTYGVSKNGGLVLADAGGSLDIINKYY